MTKQELVLNYVEEKISSLNNMGIFVSKEQVNKLLNNYIDMAKETNEIFGTIDVLVQTVIDDFNNRREERQKFIEKLSEVKELQELPLKYTGITLNNQDIDLMLIVNSNNLEETLKQITNIKTTIDPTVDIEEGRQRIFDLYMSSLSSRIEYYADSSIQLSKKIEYLKQSGILSQEEITEIDRIVSSSQSQREVMINLARMYAKDSLKLHRIYETIRDYTPIEKTGIIGTNIEAYKNLYSQIQQNYNSLTIDDEGKYGLVSLQDGTFNFKHLQKSLEFAKANGKQVRLNALIFYMDCPEYLYQMPQDDESKEVTKQRLVDYVSATTKFISENGYSDVVRSYDVFNELLNRFAMSSENPYMYRGDIPQIPTIMPNGDQVVDDNIKSGWLKHLDITDLCDVIAVARKNLPTGDFMFNDDNLTDPRKIPANMKLISQIRKYEQEHGIKLIDSIGTQMHIDNSVTKKDIENMIRSLARFGLPIEITEFDLAMTSDVEGLSDIQIETLRQQKINEVYSVIDELKDACNIRGFTIWSKTDKQNFRVSLENAERIQNRQEPITTLHGGAFTEDMKPKSKVYEKILLKNDFQSFNYHTHTNRCGHASISDESEYVATAKANGITQLGFSEHVSNGINREQQKNKPKILVKTNNSNNNFGFTNVVTLALLVTFVCGVAVGIGYMLYKYMLLG